ncbi:MAG: hypothetical protein NVS9B1_11780 [Candidatus Dormibacteraceae bacterium]
MAVLLAALVTLTWQFALGQGLLVAIAAAALTCLALGLLGLWTRGIGWGCACLAAAFVVRLQLDPRGAGPWTALFAGGLLLTAELAFWSYETAAGRSPSDPALRHRLGLILLLVAGAAVLGEVALIASTLIPAGGVALVAGGVIAALAVLAIITALERRLGRAGG